MWTFFLYLSLFFPFACICGRWGPSLPLSPFSQDWNTLPLHLFSFSLYHHLVAYSSIDFFSFSVFIISIACCFFEESTFLSHSFAETVQRNISQGRFLSTRTNITCTISNGKDLLCPVKVMIGDRIPYLRYSAPIPSGVDYPSPNSTLRTPCCLPIFALRLDHWVTS